MSDSKYPLRVTTKVNPEPGQEPPTPDAIRAIRAEGERP